MLAAASGACLFGLLVSCASTPDFKPSKPVEEASTFPEALGICGEYSLGSDGDARERPVTHAELVPWMRCFETAIQRFAQARENESFVLFFHELARFDGKEKDRRAPVARGAMDLAVKSVLAAVGEEARGRRRTYTPEEKRAIGEAFPGYLDYLASVAAP